ncbi:hypothetical protein Pelo_15251 [Pelomyxa schiedti]|nr:hypothetical protein Pelo_15251 [Pelomyxa schiedti]
MLSAPLEPGTPITATIDPLPVPSIRGNNDQDSDEDNNDDGDMYHDASSVCLTVSRHSSVSSGLASTDTPADPIIAPSTTPPMDAGVLLPLATLPRAASPPITPLSLSRHAQKPLPATPWQTLIRTVSWLVMLSYIGGAIRMLLEAATDALASHSTNLGYAVMYKDAIPNMAGCFAMGVIVSQKGLLAGTPLFVGLTTGMCGSITTLSGWGNFVCHEFANGNIASGIACFLFGWCTSLVSYNLGKQYGGSLERKPRRSRPGKIAVYAIVMTLLVWVSVAATCTTFLRRYFLALCLCPFGSFVRWSASKIAGYILGKAPTTLVVPTTIKTTDFDFHDADFSLQIHDELPPRPTKPAPRPNAQDYMFHVGTSCGMPVISLWKRTKIPIHTLTANTIACALYACLLRPLSHVPGTYLTTETVEFRYDFVWATTAGFCGCCSTVSTLVHEVVSGGMSRPVLYTYGLITSSMVLLCFILAIKL